MRDIGGGQRESSRPHVVGSSFENSQEERKESNMKRFLTMALVGIAALGLTSTAYANLCANDVVPAATLLFPFVSYDYDAGTAGNAGATTLLAITNVSNTAQIVHITLWTDYSIAILDFNIVLTGYDVQTMNIRDILRDGIIPFEEGEVVGAFTGNANIWEIDNEGPLPEDLGPFSSNNQLHPSAISSWFGAVGLPAPEPTATDDGTGSPISPLDCAPTLDASPNNYFANLPIDGGTLSNFRSFLESSMTADTWYANCVPTTDIDWPAEADPLDVIPAADFDPNLPVPWWIDGYMHPAWMYITADVVGQCNKDLPDSDFLTYFGTPSGVVYDNVLMGDVFWLDPADEAGGVNFSEADVAVHIEAGNDGTGPGFPYAAGVFPPSVGDDEGVPTTFYSRYHVAQAATVQDYREPLGTAWGLRYLHAPNAGDAASTSIRAWKGATNNLLNLAEDLSNGDYTLGPDELYSNSCTPYTYYSWDEDENIVGVSGGFVPPWSGEDPQPLPQPNLFPLETQEVPARQFYLVGDFDVAFGWMLFVWPRSNTVNAAGVAGVDLDQYQTWMGVKYQAFGNSSVAFSANQMANYNCDGAAGGATLPFPLLNSE
jgi:hypothetical protein